MHKYLECVSLSNGVECPLDYELVSCMALTLSTNLDGWYYTNDNSCFSRDDLENNMYQSGICCRLKYEDHAHDNVLILGVYCICIIHCML